MLLGQVYVGAHEEWLSSGRDDALLAVDIAGQLPQLRSGDNLARPLESWSAIIAFRCLVSIRSVELAPYSLGSSAADTKAKILRIAVHFAWVPTGVMWPSSSAGEEIREPRTALNGYRFDWPWSEPWKPT